MSKIIAVTNQKGGVGKTTSCINLSAGLAKTKKRVLLIDFDPQGNATMGSGVDKMTLKHSANNVLLGEVDIVDAIVPTTAEFDLLPANEYLTVSEVNLLEHTEREHVLKKILAPIKKKYDFIIIDCPPTLNMLTVNSLVAADSVIIPIQCEYYALEGLTALLGTIKQIVSKSNPDLKIEGLLRTMYDGRNCLAVDVSKHLLTHFGKQVFRTVIPRNVRLAEAPSHGLSVIQYDKKSQGALAYLTLAGEVIRRGKKS